jgi:hypothetical protein
VPPIDLVGDLAAHERVLEHPATARSSGRRPRSRATDAPRRQPLDLADDEPRLGVLVVDLATLDRVALAESVHSDLAMRRGCWR